jgi:hypothetical protein
METVNSERGAGKKGLLSNRSKLLAVLKARSHHNLCKSTYKFGFVEELDCGLHHMKRRRGVQRGKHVLHNEHMKAGGAKLLSLSSYCIINKGCVTHSGLCHLH